MGTQGGPFLTRFWKRIDVRGPDECWPWTGAHNPYGYGVLQTRALRGSGRVAWAVAHRLSWELANALPAPEELEVCHACDNPPCVNPNHLWLGTHQDNMNDAVKKGRMHGPVMHPRPHVAKPLSARRRNELLRYATDTDLPAEERAEFQAIIDRGVWWGPP